MVTDGGVRAARHAQLVPDTGTSSPTGPSAHTGLLHRDDGTSFAVPVCCKSWPFMAQMGGVAGAAVAATTRPRTAMARISTLQIRHVSSENCALCRQLFRCHPAPGFEGTPAGSVATAMCMLCFSSAVWCSRWRRQQCVGAAGVNDCRLCNGSGWLCTVIAPCPLL